MPMDSRIVVFRQTGTEHWQHDEFWRWSSHMGFLPRTSQLIVPIKLIPLVFGFALEKIWWAREAVDDKHGDAVLRHKDGHHDGFRR